MTGVPIEIPGHMVINKRVESDDGKMCIRDRSVEDTYDSVFNDLENVIEKAEKKDTPTEN